jgi:uncharacterized BrkB/YihY/UPF0761 family membrane protein
MEVNDYMALVLMVFGVIVFIIGISVGVHSFNTLHELAKAFGGEVSLEAELIAFGMPFIIGLGICLIFWFMAFVLVKLNVITNISQAL